jgi:hypothetical protein
MTIFIGAGFHTQVEAVPCLLWPDQFDIGVAEYKHHG